MRSLLSQTIRKQTKVQEREHPAEMARLMMQDRMLTLGMGSLFPEYRKKGSCTLPENIQAILDVGCGTGGWVLDVAHTYPNRRVIGIDSSPTIIRYNQAQAIAQRLSNVSFVVMDTLEPLGFLEGTFDLVNVRFAAAFVERVQFAPFLQNCREVLRKGGILRVTEGEIADTTSPAVKQMDAWAAQVRNIRGYGFSHDGSGIGTQPVLGLLLQRSRCVNIQFHPHLLDCSSGTALHDSQFQNYMVWPILIKSAVMDEGITTEEAFDQMYDQMLVEMLDSSFRGAWKLFTFLGKR